MPRPGTAFTARACGRARPFSLRSRHHGAGQRMLAALLQGGGGGEEVVGCAFITPRHRRESRKRRLAERQRAGFVEGDSADRNGRAPAFRHP